MGTLDEMRNEFGPELAMKALVRLASMEGFVSAGLVGDSRDGRELKARVQFARDILELLGVKHSASYDATTAERIGIERIVSEFRSEVNMPFQLDGKLDKL